MTVYNPTAHQNVYEVSGALEKLWGIDQTAIHLSELGIIDLVVGAVAPGSKTTLWLDSTGSPAAASVLKVHNGAAWVVCDKTGFLKHIWNNGYAKWTSAVPPGVANDNTIGFSVGSLWFDTTAKIGYVCLDASTGAAVWRQIDQVYTHPNHTGDVTSTGDGATTIANNAVTTAKIANDAVTFAKIQNIAANNVILGNDNGAGQDVQELTASEVIRILEPVTTEYNIVSYGAVGDDATDNTAAIQACFNACKAGGGGTIVIPEGIFRTGPVVYDISALASDYQQRVKIRGCNKRTSILKMVGNAGVLLAYLGNSGANQTGYLQLDSFTLISDKTAGSYGLVVRNAAFSSISGVNVISFDFGFGMIDVDQTSFNDSTFRFNNYGMQLNVGVPTTTGPNSITFNNCNISNNTNWGIHFVNPEAVTFNGGSIQYNGTTPGNANMWGIKLEDGAGSGYSTVNFIGTIFEGNTGTADVWVASYTADFVNVNFIGCSWYRTGIFGGAFGYSTNGVRMDGTSTETRYTFSGNTWFDGSGYVDSAARPWIGAPNANAKIYSDGSDYFGPNNVDASTLEHPAFKGFMHLPSNSGLIFNFSDLAIRHSANQLTIESSPLTRTSQAAAGNLTLNETSSAGLVDYNITAGTALDFDWLANSGNAELRLASLANGYAHLSVESANNNATGSVLQAANSAAGGLSSLLVSSGSNGFAYMSLRRLGSNRWTFRKEATAEGGGNTGSHLELSRWSDAGAEIAKSITIYRDTGKIVEERPAITAGFTFNPGGAGTAQVNTLVSIQSVGTGLTLAANSITVGAGHKGWYSLDFTASAPATNGNLYLGIRINDVSVTQGTSGSTVGYLYPNSIGLTMLLNDGDVVTFFLANSLGAAVLTGRIGVTQVNGAY